MYVTAGGTNYEKRATIDESVVRISKKFSRK
jgi:hypothetical protein